MDGDRGADFMENTYFRKEKVLENSLGNQS